MVRLRRKQILGYTDRLTVRPGGLIEFKISVNGCKPYAAQLVRLINGDTCSAAANFKEVEIESPVNGKYEGRKQPIACGSCIVIENAQVLNSLDELTIATTLMPTAPTRGVQHLIAHWDARAQAGWTLCADLLLIDWLETKAFHHDIITDDLVHEEGADLLKSYDVIVTGNHPEYQTTQQLNAVESYLNQGGRLMYMGGNGFYWRTAVHPEIPGAIEVRRGRAGTGTGTGTGQSEVGESSLAFSGEVGGIWRELGRPPQRLCGVGFIAEGTGGSYYRILPEARRGRAAFILEGVDQDVIGDFGIFEGGAAGQEIDKTNASHGTPVDTIVLARSENHSSTMLYAIEEMRSIHPVIDSYRALTHAEVTYFETVLGGAVFSVGSMTWCGSLSHNGYNNNISTITENVLARFSRDAKVSVLRTLSR